MSVEEILLDTEERMEKALAKLKGDLAGIRTGRANPGLVDSLRVEVYGSPTPIKAIASVGAPEPTQIMASTAASDTKVETRLASSQSTACPRSGYSLGNAPVSAGGSGRPASRKSSRACPWR